MTDTTPKTTSRLNIKSLSPSLTASDLTRSIKFYEGLGFAVDDRWEQDGKLMGVMLRAGSAFLGLSQDDFAKGRDRVKGVGMRIFLETDQDIDDLAAKSKAAGVVLDADPAETPWGTRAFGATDPDGFKVTITSES